MQVYEPGVGASAVAYSAIVGPVLPAPPGNATPPSISGTARDGEDLAAGLGAWTNGGAAGAPSLGVAWQRCAADGSACANVPGPMSGPYVAGADDVGSRLRVVVTATNAGGATPLASATSTVVAPRSTAAPLVAGEPADGDVLAAGPGSWNGAAGLAHAYRWQRCDAAGTGCADLAGATAAAYTPGPADVGHALRVVVSASAGGSSATAAASAATAPVAPVATGQPAISGTAREGAVLGATGGAWNGAANLALTYRWLRCDAAAMGCAEVAGTTAASYAPTAADVGSTLRVRVTADAAGSRRSSTSAATSVVQAAPVDGGDDGLGRPGTPGAPGAPGTPGVTTPAPAPTTMTATLDRDVVRGGAAVVVRGRVDGPGAAGRAIEARLVHPFGGAAVVARGVVRADGSFALRLRPSVTAAATVTLPAAGSLPALSVQTARVRVQPLLRAAFTGRPDARGTVRDLRVRGTVLPGGGPAVRLVWQARSSARGAWQAFCTARPIVSGRGGAFTASCGVRRLLATNQYRVAFVAQPGGPYLGATSAPARARTVR